mmetsp:Transcript_30659/g.64787  ORF Transcript_30659/g.64787 Transcript_30659/m.64787 type:complete len:1099 (+) Transcript_30659:67-3363(+)
MGMLFWNERFLCHEFKVLTQGVDFLSFFFDLSCLCKTNVEESVVFTNIVNISKEDVMSQLSMGAPGPQDGSVPTNISNGLTVHMVGGNVDSNTVFEVQDKGRTLYLKNVLSTVSLEGWAMPPQIYEAEDAIISNAPVMNNSASATGGLYVYTYDGDSSSSIEWNLNATISGTYSITLRYALDESPRPVSVFVNEQEILRQLENPNPTVPFNNIGSNPSGILQRCDGDCDSDDECGYGLHCMHKSDPVHVPGCNDTQTDGWDYCVDINDFDYGFTLLTSGGWDDDWYYSEPLQVNLTAGPNKIRVQIPPGHNAGPSIDHLKVEGLPMFTSPSSFRNPPHFMGIIPDYSPFGLGEQNLRDAQYETDAVLDHYFYQDNIAPFLCTRIMQRLSFSNPSPRYVAGCVAAFRTGIYTSGSETFGSGKYGSLEALVASIILDSEATDGAISSDPGYGSIREPMLKVMHLMRSMDYQTSIPTTLDGAPMQTTYNAKLWKIDEKIGQGPYEFPTVFSFFLPEYVPDSGPNLPAKLASPESMIVTMPNTINLLNGMFSLIKYGLSDCNSGFSTYPGHSGCSDNGLYLRSYGHLFYKPTTNATDYGKAAELALLLTAGRLNEDNLNTIVDACSSEPDDESKTRCMQQLIITTGEFHSTNHVTHSGDNRNSRAVMDDSSSEPYKALVYLYLEGGVDSYNMLAPYHCAPIDVHERYLTIRGKTSKDDGIGLPLDQMLEIPSNNPNQPCTSFGIHEKLGVLKNLYQHTLFIANAGLLSKPVTVADYKADMDVQLFSHNSMLLETHKDDVESEYLGTGVGGRLADVLTEAGIATSLFSIKGQQIFLSGEEGLAQYILSSEGLEAFNENPSINNMTGVIMALNNATSADSGYFAETYSSKVSDSISQYQLLKKEFDNAETSVEFPDSDIANQLKIVTQLMKSASVRRSKRDIFYVSHVGYDDHRRVVDQLNKNFVEINAAIEAFVDELKALQLWESTVILQFSEFGRTLSPNTGDGSDHGWGGNHFMLGGSVKGGAVLGQYPDDFEESRSNNIALRRGRLIPTTPWDAMLKGTAEWFGVGSSDMDKVLPMHKNFPPELIYGKDDLFVNDLEPAS